MKEELPFPTFGLSEAVIALFLETYNTISENLPVHFAEPIELNPNKFMLLNGYGFADVRESLRIDNGSDDCYINFVRVQYSYTGVKGWQHTANEYQTWGTALLRNSFGHVMIRPESFADRIQELIQPVEVDFPEDPAFSKRYYVLAKDKLKASLAMTMSFRNCLMNLNLINPVIEIVNNRLIIGNKKLIDSATALRIAKFIEKVSKL